MKRVIKSSRELRVTGRNWEEFIENLENTTHYKVDSAYRRRYDQWIVLIDPRGNLFDAEVTRYSDGEIELMGYNISPVYDIEESCSIEAEEFFDKGEDGEYWYFTKHGVQPGSIPRGLEILDLIDRPEGTYFLTNRVLTTDALNHYDIKEKSPI